MRSEKCIQHNKEWHSVAIPTKFIEEKEGHLPTRLTDKYNRDALRLLKCGDISRLVKLGIDNPQKIFPADLLRVFLGCTKYLVIQ